MYTRQCSSLYNKPIVVKVSIDDHPRPGRLLVTMPRQHVYVRQCHLRYRLTAKLQMYYHAARQTIGRYGSSIHPGTVSRILKRHWIHCRRLYKGSPFLKTTIATLQGAVRQTVAG